MAGDTATIHGNGCVYEMRIHVLSDLHQEFGEVDVPSVNCDCVVLAGDVSIKGHGLKWIRRRFPDVPVIYICGNHEYYGGKLPRLTERLREAAEGTNVHFAEGKYSPGTKQGDHLLAHELTHVVQGQQAGIQRKADSLSVSQPTDGAEVEAEATAHRVVEHLHGSGAPASAPQLAAPALGTRLQLKKNSKQNDSDARHGRSDVRHAALLRRECYEVMAGRADRRSWLRNYL